MGRNSRFNCAANILQSRQCIFCGSFKINKISRAYIKCRLCRKSKSLTNLHREIEIIKGFYQQQLAYCLANDSRTDFKVVTRVYQQLREMIYHLTELEDSKLKSKIAPYREFRKFFYAF